MDYVTAKELLDRSTTRNGRRKLANNTYLEWRGENIAIRLHATDIVTLTPDYAELNTGGWYTVTTKDRIDTYAPMRVSQSNSVWYLGAKQSSYTLATGDSYPEYNPPEFDTNDEESLAAFYAYSDARSILSEQYRERFEAWAKENSPAIPFFDGVRVSYTGKVLNPPAADAGGRPRPRARI